MLSLPAITSLMVYNNQLSSIPNFAGQVNKTNLTLNFRSNFLDFSQLEVMVGQGIKSVTLVPVQNIKDVTSVGYQPGDPLIIPARPTGVNSTITWEKQAVNGTWSSVNSINQDATQKTFLRNTPNASDNGYYRWKMTNTLFSGTTLFSEPIYVGELSELEEAKTLYNGLITAASWRTDKVYGVNGSDLTGMYLYDYDEKYQLKEAVFATPNFTASTYVLAGNNYRVGGMEYDPNGNIKKLKRYKGNGQIQHDFGYTYIPNTNQLTSVSSYAGYEYNKIGQTTKVDKVANDGKDQYIDYDVTGKVVAVFEDVNKTKVTTRYTYDDRGFRLTKADYDAKGALTKTYWYIRDASGNVLSIYEQVSTINTTFTDFKQTEVPIYGAGKIGTYYAGSSVAADQAQVEAGTTAYEITDHLGNVRAVLRVQPNEYTATMEDDGTTAYTNPRVRENVYFKNLFETEKRDAQMNHTPDDGVVSTPVPNTSSYLYWINGQAGITPDKKSVGPATALLVNPGDKLDLSAWVRYKIKTSYSKAPLNSIIATVLASSFAFSNGMETVAQATTKFNEALLVNLLSPVSDEPDRPYAYLNYIIFNSNNVAIKRDAKRVPLSAGFDEAQRGNGYSQDNLVKFDSPIVIEQLGYIYIWVSNETENTEVWFDDVSVMHYKGVVTQATEYGAWGEVMREQRLDLASGELTAPLLKDNIQANYKLDGNALDSGPNAMNGTVTGATPTTDRDNQAGKAYSFNGTSKIDLPGTAQKLSFIQNTGVFTFSVFMKVSNVDPTTIYCPVGNAVSTLQKGFYLSYGPLTAGTPRQVGFNMMRGVSGTSIYAKSAGNSINDTNWHHIAVVGDGTVVKIYVDGVQSGTPIAFTGTTGDGTLDVIMGGTRNTNGSLIYGFSGGLDGLLVFDRNLTDEEIAALATGKPTEDIDAETLSQKYRYGYQGKFAERDEETGWNHFELREYDPVIGRWLQFDPKGQHYSPYVGMGNNPVSGIDPDGGWFFHIGLLQDAFNWFKGLFTGGTKKLIGTAKANATLKYEETANLGSNYENRIAQNDESNSPDALQNDFDRASTALKVEAVSSVVEITNDGVTFVSLFTPLAAVETAAARGAAAVSVEGAVWAQTKFSGKFSAGGKFAGQTVEGVAAALRNGNLSAADVPIDVIVRNGQTFILNTRSSAALTMAGIPRSAWKVVNRTGQAAFEGRLTNQLLKNAIPNGTNTIKSGSTILTH
jgi:RHS repeat-associated protein